MGMMTPFYERDGITIYCGDCLEVMPQLKIQFDAVITDPPYGTNDGRGKVHKIKNELVEFDVGEWDKILPLEWIKLAMFLLKSGCWIIVFTDNLSVKTVWDEIEDNNGNGKQTFYWIKSNPPPQPRNNFCSGVETAILATKGIVKKWYGGGWYKNYFEYPLVTNNRTNHPTQKPVMVINYLQNAITTNGDLILDPFMGSGTTLVAAQNGGRRAVGIEISEEYCKIAVERLRQPSLFSIIEPKKQPQQLTIRDYLEAI
jgi:site-specific DNA-methyltransferase (adenine-specific)